MPADELIAAAKARVSEPNDEEWPMPAGLHDRDHWTVYLMSEEYGVPPHPGPAHEWPPTLVADLRRARYAMLYAGHHRATRVRERGPIEAALSSKERGLLADARRARDQLVAARVRSSRPTPARRR